MALRIQTKIPQLPGVAIENQGGVYFVSNPQVIVSASDHVRALPLPEGERTMFPSIYIETIPSPQIKRRSPKYLLVCHSIHSTA